MGEFVRPQRTHGRESRGCGEDVPRGWVDLDRSIQIVITEQGTLAWVGHPYP